ncbi:hypothetical protein BJI69_17985 [Luteibacter rhizovicinus DSM 16549]|uniref:Uncharacterized protein n=1 Tax=Luteibacter rhizovicinus DSM 16549 TaxID=1440763 RepID=A0A0G9HBY9_9GAMM|nr:hypothetical protein [Luteibacter rhizovicinus]APG05607.1 hypothetical protein BJI69_17985 [Luteibacter rhizovicinus DSM 16549]KLD67006.1 hypothetical protein Y883_10590 [Luteibacter rhizovicinus DSM 16549]KLD79581.1 hypothetical protein Y886_03740 [Xanthomonas hyacinthi DSM 19077]
MFRAISYFFLVRVDRSELAATNRTANERSAFVRLLPLIGKDFTGKLALPFLRVWVRSLPATDFVDLKKVESCKAFDAFDAAFADVFSFLAMIFSVTRGCI